jgi:hypothetical protein
MEESTLLPRAVAEAAGLSTSSRAGVTLDNVSDLAERLGRPGPE